MSTKGAPRLLGLAQGALDPGAERRVLDEIVHDPAAQRALRAKRRLPQDPALPAWRLPPPRLSIGGLELWSQPSRAATGPAQAQALSLLLRAPIELGARLVVLLRRAHLGWELISPRGPQELRGVQDLPLEPDGSRRLDLDPQLLKGALSWALVLPEREWVLDWQASDPWASLREAIPQGQIPTVVL